MMKSKSIYIGVIWLVMIMCISYQNLNSHPNVEKIPGITEQNEIRGGFETGSNTIDYFNQSVAMDNINIPNEIPMTSDVSKNFTSGQYMEYNVLTGEVKEFSNEFIFDESHFDKIRKGFDPYEINLNENDGIVPELVHGTDDRTLITDTTPFPYRAICRLRMNFNGLFYIGTGALVDDNHVLTCAHNIYNIEEGWADSVIVTPGLNGAVKPYGETSATYLRTFTGWTTSEDTEHDMALITLNSEIGDLTGWFGMRTADSDASFYKGLLNTAGYPGEIIDDGDNMYYTSGYGQYATENNHYYDLDSEGGQSGSPVWTYDGVNRYIVSVHAYGYNPYNFGTRLNSQKYYTVLSWIASDDSVETKPDLLYNGDAFIDKSLVGPSTYFTVSITVGNFGTSSTSSFYVAFYFSSNEIISTLDVYLGRDLIYGLGIGESTEATLYTKIPSDILTDEYYFGWIIDSSNLISESNESNNEGISLSKIIEIDNSKPDNVTIFTEYNGLISNSSWHNLDQLRFNWNTPLDIGSGIAGFYCYWGLQKTGISSTLKTNNYEDISIASSGIYYYRIQTVDKVNLKSDWVTLFIYQFDNVDPTNPNDCSQQNGYTSSGIEQIDITNPFFTWTASIDYDSGLAGYNIYWGIDPVGESNSFITVNNYTPSVVNDDGSYYLRIQAVDNAGNKADWETIYIFVYKYDPFIRGLSTIAEIALFGGVGGVAITLTSVGIIRKRKNNFDLYSDISPKNSFNKFDRWDNVSDFSNIEKDHDKIDDGWN